MMKPLLSYDKKQNRNITNHPVFLGRFCILSSKTVAVFDLNLMIVKNLFSCLLKIISSSFEKIKEKQKRNEPQRIFQRNFEEPKYSRRKS